MSESKLLDQNKSFASNSASSSNNQEADKYTMRTTTLNENEPEILKKQKKCNWAYWAPRIVIILILVTVAILAFVFRAEVSEGLTSFAEWI